MSAFKEIMLKIYPHLVNYVRLALVSLNAAMAHRKKLLADVAV